MNSNSLYAREECPKCHYSFICGYSNDTARTCPSCQQQFMHGMSIDHGKNCAICRNRYHGANNVYYQDGCPALMSDGRFITDYNSSNELTEAMRQLNGFVSPNEFRQFMQENGDQFMNADRERAFRRAA